MILEDISENPGQVLRSWQQWLHIGRAIEPSAIVLGKFLSSGEYSGVNGQELIYKKLSESVSCPVFSTQEIGHGPLNMPFQIGKPATIENNKLKLNFGHQTLLA